MKRKPQLTKRQRKSQDGRVIASSPTAPAHIHCIACGRHLDPHEFNAAPATALRIRCAHGSHFPCCASCTVAAQTLVDAHDRDGTSVRAAAPWH